MAKILYVRNNENTEWVEIASSIPDIPDISTFASIDYVDNEINNIDALPSQIGNNNKFLTTSGSVASWATVDLTSAINTASAAAVTYLVDSAPATLDTLNELAAALGDDENFATTVTNSLSNKLDISSASNTYLTQSSASTTYLTQSVASSTYATKASPTFTGLVNNAAGANIASATAIDLTNATGNTVVITGTTPVTSLVMNTGQQMILLPSGALPLTFHATNMNINGNVDYTCVAGDRLYCVKDLAGVIRVSVMRQSGVAQGIPFTATGGTITTLAGYTIHTFTTSGTFTPSKSGNVEYLVVAGGGGSPNDVSGGGGGGGFLTNTEFAVTATGLTVTVGAGGTGSANGSNSVFSSITSLGGGYGGNYNSYGGNSGGSGGGGGGSGGAGGAGTAGQGFAGGNPTQYPYSGGGGGAGAPGVNAIYGTPAAGGIGKLFYGTYYAGGGGGGQGAAGGSGGGGTGGIRDVNNGSGGTANTGGGAGGNGGLTGSKSGGSGIVIIRYLT